MIIYVCMEYLVSAMNVRGCNAKQYAWFVFPLGVEMTALNISVQFFYYSVILI